MQQILNPLAHFYLKFVVLRFVSNTWSKAKKHYNSAKILHHISYSQELQALMTLKTQKFYPAKYECKNMYCIKDYKGVNLY